MLKIDPGIAIEHFSPVGGPPKNIPSRRPIKTEEVVELVQIAITASQPVVPVEMVFCIYDLKHRGLEISPADLFEEEQLVALRFWDFPLLDFFLTNIRKGLLVDFTGIDFALTALFVTIFVEQWLSTKNHLPALVGVGSAVLCLVIFGAENFLIPTMILIAAILIMLQKTGKEEAHAAH